jgi:ethanolamine ammonia-lyase large subunit
MIKVVCTVLAVTVSAVARHSPPIQVCVLAHVFVFATLGSLHLFSSVC